MVIRRSLQLVDKQGVRERRLAMRVVEWESIHPRASLVAKMERMASMGERVCTRGMERENQLSWMDKMDDCAGCRWRW